MAYLHEHCFDCKQRLGKEWKEVHKWLDALFAEYGAAHRCHRHHTEGIEEIRRMWGDEAAIAAKIHVLVDCWGIPSRADYENGWVNSNGYTEESTEQEALMMLKAITEEVRAATEKRLLYLAIKLFEGNEAEAKNWLNTPNTGLDGNSPFEHAKTDVGSQEVEALIIRLEHVVF
ncbi:DUF6915 family protein [Thiovibrio sp. JS02]